MGQLKALKNDVEAITLVGGFGQSAYLREPMHKEVQSAFGAKTGVIQTPNEDEKQKISASGTSSRFSICATGTAVGLGQWHTKGSLEAFLERLQKTILCHVSPR